MNPADTIFEIRRRPSPALFDHLVLRVNRPCLAETRSQRKRNTPRTASEIKQPGIVMHTLIWQEIGQEFFWIGWAIVAIV